MATFLQIVQIVSGLLVVLLVLLHSPKGSGLAAIGDAAQLFSSQKSVESGLNKITTIFSYIFMCSSLILGFKLISMPVLIGFIVSIGAVGVFVNRK